MITIPIEDWVFGIAALVGGVLLLITVVFDDILGGLLYGGFWLLVGIWAYSWAAQRWPALLPANERREPSRA